MEGGQNRRSMEGGWVSHWNPDSHPDSYPPTAVSCPGAGHMCQDPSAWHLGHCICTEPAAHHLLSSSREWPSCPPLLLDLPVGTHQTTWDLFPSAESTHSPEKGLLVVNLIVPSESSSPVFSTFFHYYPCKENFKTFLPNPPFHHKTLNTTNILYFCLGTLTLQAIELLNSFSPTRTNFYPLRGDIPPVDSQTLDNSCHLCLFQEPLCQRKGCWPFYTLFSV